MLFRIYNKSINVSESGNELHLHGEKYLPKGKLRGFSEKQLQQQGLDEELLSPAGQQPLEVVSIERSTPREQTEREQPSELDELEKQLRDIESQLQNIR